MESYSSQDELRFAREQGFFDKNRAVRICIALLFGISLFAFLHFREIQVEILEVGSVAPRYVMADVDFTFQDDEATTILRQEALLDIGKIYNIDTDDIKRRRLEFEHQLVYDSQWRSRIPQGTFDEMYKSIELMEKILGELRFCDYRTLEKMKDLNITQENYLELAPFDPSQGVLITEKTWDEIRHLADSRHMVSDQAIDFVISFFHDKIWTLTQDAPAERRLRRLLQATISPKLTFIPAGTRIIEPGERITNRHVSMLQAMKQAIQNRRNLWHPRTIAGSLILTFLTLFVGFLFLKTYQPFLLKSNRRLFLFVVILLLGLAFAKVVEFILLNTTNNLYDVVHYPLLAPFMSIMLACLLNAEIAIFATAVMTTLFGIVLAVDHYGFMLTNIFVSMFAILYTRSIRKRTEIFVICAKAWLACSGIIIACYFYDRSRLEMSIVQDMFSSGLFMLFTAVLVVGLLPIFETSFRILTDITLMEYMDPNHELLKRLTVEAPGTYQHSLIMGNIAESAAHAIGANGLFCRVATLYHDIGKMNIAQYFTENQQPGMNIHQLLTPVESAQVIMSHVSEGVTLARKAGLPEQFIDIIKEHHGTTLVYYFYHKQLQAVGENKDLCNEKDFRYPGPKPKTKESVVIMVADSLEAASRSLDEVTEEALERLLDTIVKEKIADGQFDESILTFQELGIIKKALIKSLLAIGHFRIKYPARLKKEPHIETI